MPLTNVLDSLAEQSGARWGKTHAVYDSESALTRLEGVFGGGSSLDAAGWTNLAPRFAKTEMPDINLAGGGSGPRRMIVNSPDGSPGGAAGRLQGDPDSQKVSPGAGFTLDTEDVSAGPGPGVKVMRRGGPGQADGQPQKRVMVRVMKGSGGTTTTTTTTQPWMATPSGSTLPGPRLTASSFNKTIGAGNGSSW